MTEGFKLLLGLGIYAVAAWLCVTMVDWFRDRNKQ
jgi:hypothetical protein